MNNKLFIVKPYDASISNVSGTVSSVPVWVHLYNLPLFAWSPLGINWLSSHLGKLLCMDAMTEKQERLTYAKCLIEVKPDKELVDEFLIKLVEGGTQKIYVQYLWRPDVCVICKNFGHETDCCDRMEIKHKANEKENRDIDSKGKEREIIEKGQVKRNVKPLQKRVIRKWQRVKDRRKENLANERKMEQGKGRSEEHEKDNVSDKMDTERGKEVCNNEEPNSENKGNEIVESEVLTECANASVTDIIQVTDEEVYRVNTVKSDGSTEDNNMVDNLITTNQFEALLNIDEEGFMNDMCEENQKEDIQDEIAYKEMVMQETAESQMKNKDRSNSVETQGEAVQNVQKQDNVNIMQIPEPREADHSEDGNSRKSKSEEDPNNSGKKNGKNRNMKMKQRITASKQTGMHKEETTCTDYQPNFQTAISPSQLNDKSLNQPITHIYSKIKPPLAYKPPPPLPIHETTPTKTNPTTSPKSDVTSSMERTPLSDSIPNYLSSSQAVTRRMKIEMLNARVIQ
jgi:hypothetical protein